MANQIQILRSVGNTAPTGLAQGEMAYVEASGTGDGRLYIGAAGSTVEVIGGQYFIDLLNSYDTDLPTFSVPASTTITAFGATVTGAANSAAGTALFDLATASAKGLMPILSANAAEYLDGTGSFTVPAGGGDVAFNGGTVPADNALVRFDGITGKLIQESSIIIDDSENVTGMGTLNGKTIANLVSTTDTGSAAWTWIIDEDLMGSNSDTHVPTQQSVKAYVDTAVTSSLTYKGGFDPTFNAGQGNPDLDTITSTTGDFYTVTAAGTYSWTTGSAILEVGDSLIAESDGVLNDVADWTIVQNNLSAATYTTPGYVSATAAGTEQEFGGTKVADHFKGKTDGTATLDQFIIDGGTF